MIHLTGILSARHGLNLPSTLAIKINVVVEAGVIAVILMPLHHDVQVSLQPELAYPTVPKVIAGLYQHYAAQNLHALEVLRLVVVHLPVVVARLPVAEDALAVVEINLFSLIK